MPIGTKKLIGSLQNKMKGYISTTVLFFLLLIACQSHGQYTLKSISKPAKELYKLELIVGDLANPWGMAFLPDGSILISEKSGTLILFKEGERKRISNPPKSVVIGQGGLMDIELHPNYEENGWIYFTYASDEGEGRGANTAIMRAKLQKNSLKEHEVLYKASPNTDAFAHWGSRIEFDRNGYVYFSIGDRFKRDENPQNIQKDGGKIYRLKDDGTVPEDNPFYAVEGAKKAIYSYGHRNPQGMAINPLTGRIWIHEHGPKGGDEINILKAGKNYGWPKVTFGKNYDGTKITDKQFMLGMEPPTYYWIPSIAPCGMTFVSSDKYPLLKGDLLVGSLKFGYLEWLGIEDLQVINRTKLFENIGRVRNVRQAADDYLYIAVEGKGIYRIVPNP